MNKDLEKLILDLDMNELVYGAIYDIVRMADGEDYANKYVTNILWIDYWDKIEYWGS